MREDIINIQSHVLKKLKKKGMLMADTHENIYIRDMETVHAKRSNQRKSVGPLGVGNTSE
jgi:hypothetical protein